MPRFLTPLRHRRLALLVGGQLTSNFGDAFYAVALPWYVLATHGGALLLGTVLAAYGIPRTVLLIVGGSAADRWRPWTVMLAADAVRMGAVGALAGVALAGPARAATLVPIAVVLGAGEGMFLPGSFSIMPSLVPGPDLQAANALASSGTQVASLAGPALGGAVVGLLGPAPGFAIDAVTFAVSSATLLGIRHAARGPVPDAAPAEGAAAPAGVALASESGAVEDGGGAAGKVTVGHLLRRSRVLQVGLIVTLVANLGSGGMSEVALPALAHGPLATGAGGYGGLIAAFGAGALIGTLLAGSLRPSARPAVLASWLFLADGALFASVPYFGSAYLSGVALAFGGACNGFANVLTITAFQRWAQPALLGRLMGVLMTASLGTFPLSVAAAGVVVHAAGPAIWFPLAAAALAVAIAAALSQRAWREFGAETPSREVVPPAPGGPVATGPLSPDG